MARYLLLLLRAHYPQVVVFLLLVSPDHPLVIGWAPRIDLNGHQLETGRQLHLRLEDLLTCPVGWLLKSLKPESFGALITTITKASISVRALVHVTASTDYGSLNLMMITFLSQT